MSSITPVHDSRFPVKVTSSLSPPGPDYRVVVYSTGAARLFVPSSTSPQRRLESAEFRSQGDQWIVEGTNEQGNPEVWSYSQKQARSGCIPCGAKR